MKAVWIAMMFIFSRISCYHPDPVNTTCSSPNPYILKFTTPVEIYKSPVILTNSSCKGEWDVYGSCCNPDQLLEHYKKDKRRINRSMERVTNSFLQLRSAIQKIRDLVLKEATLNQTNNPAITVIQERAKSLVNSPAFKNYFKFFADMNSTEFEEFSLSNERCWQEMIRVRAASLCTTCSGRGHLFFEKGKGRVSKKSCSKILSECSKPLLGLLKLVRGIHEIHPLLQHLEEFGIHTNLKKKLDLVKCEIYSETINSMHINNTIRFFLI